jgi:hypothetical protein
VGCGVLRADRHNLARRAAVWVGTCGKMCGEKYYGLVCIVYGELKSWCTCVAGVGLDPLYGTWCRRFGCVAVGLV